MARQFAVHFADVTVPVGSTREHIHQRHSGRGAACLVVAARYCDARSRGDVRSCGVPEVDLEAKLAELPDKAPGQLLAISLFEVSRAEVVKVGSTGQHEVGGVRIAAATATSALRRSRRTLTRKN